MLIATELAEEANLGGIMGERRGPGRLAPLGALCVSAASWVSEGGFEPLRPVRGTRPSNRNGTCRPVASDVVQLRLAAGTPRPTGLRVGPVISARARRGEISGETDLSRQVPTPTASRAQGPARGRHGRSMLVGARAAHGRAAVRPPRRAPTDPTRPAPASEAERPR
jgi:hypothetical protein